MKKIGIILLFLLCMTGCTESFSAETDTENRIPETWETMDVMEPEQPDIPVSKAEEPEVFPEEPADEPYIRLVSGEDTFSCTMLTIPGESVRYWRYDDTHVLYLAYTHVTDEKNRLMACEDKHLYLADLTTGTIAAELEVPGDFIWDDMIHRNGNAVLCHFWLDEETMEYHADNAMQISYSNGTLSLLSGTDAADAFSPYPREETAITSPGGQYRIVSVSEDGQGHGGLDLMYPDGTAIRLFSNVTIWDTRPDGQMADISDVRGYRPIGFLDDTRFVYSVGGWEWTVGYGIYDLQNGTYASFSGGVSGIHEGQIYLTENHSGHAYCVSHIYKSTPSGERTLLASMDKADGVYWLENTEEYFSYPACQFPYWYESAVSPEGDGVEITVYSPDLDKVLAVIEHDHNGGIGFYICENQITYVVNSK